MQKQLKILLLLSSLLITTSSCTLRSRALLNQEIKIYNIDADKGLRRAQALEVLSFDKAEGFFCLSPDDFEALLLLLAN